MIMGSTRRASILGLLALFLMMLSAFLSTMTVKAHEGEDHTHEKVAMAQAQPQVVNIKIEDYTFSPDNVTITVGTKVVWTNLDYAAHTVTNANGSFDSGPLPQNGTFEWVFQKAGTVEVYSKAQPLTRGKITIKEAPAAPATQAPATQAPPANNAQVVNVTIQNFAFSPNVLTIKAGTKVIWTNKDTARHTVTSDNGNVLASQLLAQNATFEFTFNQPGTYEYHCGPHPNMKGKIVVEAAAPAQATQAPVTTAAAAPTQAPATQAAQPANNAQVVNVTIQNFAFSPNVVTIKAGTKVVWTNKDTARHTVTSDSGEVLASQLLAKDASFEFTFNQPGTYEYHCGPHPNMKGKIVVEGAAPAQAPATTAVATQAPATTVAATTAPAATAAQAAAPAAQVVSIDIKGFAFSPNVVTITPGTKVIWTNRDSAAHTVTSDNGNAIESKLLKQNETFEMVFNEVGTYDYHCEPHPNMKGRIIVQAAQAAAPAGQAATAAATATAAPIQASLAAPAASNDTGQAAFLIVAVAIALAAIGGGFLLGRSKIAK